MTTQSLRMLAMVLGLTILVALVAPRAGAGEAPGEPREPAAAQSPRAGSAPGPETPTAGFDMKPIDEFHAFLDKHDPDLTRAYRFEFKKPDGAEAIAALEKKLIRCFFVRSYLSKVNLYHSSQAKNLETQYH